MYYFLFKKINLYQNYNDGLQKCINPASNIVIFGAMIL
jgi:hypothetical protein